MVNHRGSAALMETEGLLELYRRSMERNIRYKCKSQSIAHLLAIFLENLHERLVIALPRGRDILGDFSA